MRAVFAVKLCSGTPHRKLPPGWRASSAGVLLSLAFLLGTGEAGLASPAQAAPARGTRVSLGSVSAAPKGQVMVPLFLTPVPSETQVGSLSAAISFEGKAVSFLRADKGFLLDGVNGGIEAQLQKDSSNPNKSILQLEVTTRGENRKALREGLLLSLVFRVEADAVPETNVTLNFEKLSAATPDAPPKAIEPLVGQKGTIEVLKPESVPYVGCFFFTH